MKSYNLYNIKGFIDSGNIEIKPLTIFIGKNSSGKSSLGRFLVVLKQTLLSLKDSPLVFYDENRNFIDYGEFKDVTYNNDLENEMSFSLTIDKNDLVRKENYMYAQPQEESELDEIVELNQIDLMKKYLSYTDSVKLKVSIKKVKGNIIISKFECLSGETDILVSLERKEEDKYIVKIFAEDVTYTVPSNAVMFENFLPNYRLFNLKYPKWKDEKIMFLYELFYSVSLYLKDVAKRIEYIGPFREAPERYYRREEEVPKFVGIKGEAAPAMLAEDYRKDKKLIQGISNWLREHLNVELSIDDSEGNFSIIIKDIDSIGVENNLMDVGYGLAQLIPILVEIYNKKIYNTGSSIPSITLVEQPELHLHPAAQASLADLFIDAIDKNNRFIVETHSENFILRLRRRIVETPELRDKISLYYVEKKKEGNSEVTELEVNESGDITNWPKGLLSEDFYELLEIKKAVKKNDGKQAAKRGEFTW